MIYVLLRKICTLKSCIVLVFGIEGIGSENEVYCYFASVKCMHFVCVYLMCAGYHGCIFSRHALCDDIGIVLSFAILCVCSQCGYRCVYTVACQVKHKLTPGSCVVLEL